MTRAFSAACYICGWLVLATIGGLSSVTIVSGISGGDKAAAQQAQPKARAQKRFNFGGTKNTQTERRTKRQKRSARAPARHKLAIPKPETLLALVRFYLVGLDQAIKANDFRVLHAITAPGLQSKLTADQLAAAFANLRTRRVDLAAVVIITPQITESPKMLPGNVLNVVGYFPSRPKRIDFHMQFQPANRQWKLLGMNVSARQVKPAAPKTAAPAKAATKNKKRSATKK